QATRSIRAQASSPRTTSRSSRNSPAPIADTTGAALPPHFFYRWPDLSFRALALRAQRLLPDPSDTLEFRYTMSQNNVAAQPQQDERVSTQSRLRQAFIRPELGAMAGTVIVFIYFAIVAGGSGMFAADGIMNWGVVSAQSAIIAVGACLLMIAGEFD